jgi:hypothetical protein
VTCSQESHGHVVDDACVNNSAPSALFLTLFHRTTQEAAAAILRTGRFESKENTQDAYFSTRESGQSDGYGDAIVCVVVSVEVAELDDEFPDGEQHYRVSVADLSRANIVPQPGDARSNGGWHGLRSGR